MTNTTTRKLMLSDFDYFLPKELIAQAPAGVRHESRLMIVEKGIDERGIVENDAVEKDRFEKDTVEKDTIKKDRFEKDAVKKDAINKYSVKKDGEGKNRIHHKRFYDIVDYFSTGDVLVVNNTKVLPYKFYGNKETGGKVELVLGNRIAKYSDDKCADEGKDCKTRNLFECRIKSVKTRNWGNLFLVKASEKEKTLQISERSKKDKNFKVEDELKDKIVCKVLQKIEDKYIIEFVDENFSDEKLKRYGELPLPPYIKNYKGDASKYQTVYAKNEGSIAAPTAGLHFTEELFDKLRKKGVKIVSVCLHVSFATFNPIKTERVEDHKMEPEFFSVPKDTADAINNMDKSKNKLFVVGTTTLKTLESAADEDGCIKAGSGWSNLFIYPGYRFKVCVDRFITNFHLPTSTLMLLVSAFWGRDEILDAYSVAVKEKYRFFSFGDAMLLIK